MTDSQISDSLGYVFSKYYKGMAADNLIRLELCDDAANMSWGGGWRIPTKIEWEELQRSCKWEWTEINGVSGYNVKGQNGKSIFLPAAGRRNGEDLCDAGEFGFYWSSTLSHDESDRAYEFYSDSGGHRFFCCFRYHGLPVRPVASPSIR